MVTVYLRLPGESYAAARRTVLPAVPREGEFMLDMDSTNYKVVSIVWETSTARVYIHLDKLE